MSLRSISLRWKLVAALVLPMLVVAGYLAVSIRTSTADRAEARAESAEVERFVAVAALSDAIGEESLVIIDRAATDADLAAARATTDAAMAELRSDELAMSAEQLGLVEQRYAELADLRAVIGDRPFEIRLTAQTELRSGDLTMTGDITPALAWLSALPSIVLADFEFDSGIQGSGTAELLDDYFLVQRLRADLGREVATLSRVVSLPSNLIDASVTGLVATSMSATDQSRQFMVDLGSAQLTELTTPILDGNPVLRYDELRSGVDALEAGQSPSVDAEQLQASAAQVDAALAGAGDATIEELDSRSSDTVFRANRDLVVSALIGFWLLILVGLLLRVLYRAIKSPIERLTEQAQQISQVELPEVVEQMRRGDIDSIPHVEEIEAETKDEIGDLVNAFNEMHRTAVELAAEQANSRRVVADMFVNLGRRNQRLVNRLLKGLTVLEQHEEDPDKLDSLYEIDHVATRMRRNAESLLVLAGSGQSRRWEKPVPLYDLARASLAEVENYERVHIDVADGPEIDGGIVADLTHLLAELIENALSFSPPTSPVELIARSTDSGLLIAISDNGVGMPAEQMEQANLLIADAADEDETPSEFLGHYVVGRLAARHGLRVQLLEGPAGGVTARVFLPASMVRGPQDDLPRHVEDTPETELDQALAAVGAVADLTTSPEVPDVVMAEEEVPAEAEPDSVEPPVAEPTPAVVANVVSEPAASLAEQAPRRKPAGEPLAEVPGPAPIPAPEPERAEPTPSTAGPNPASFDWPSPAEVDPLTAEQRQQPAPEAEWNWPSERHDDPIPPMVAPTIEPVDAPPVETAPVDSAPPVAPVSEPRPALPAQPPAVPVPAAAPAEPPASLEGLGGATDQLNRAADEAVNGALSVFGVSRRTPGAQLPATDLFSSISGSMRLGSLDDDSAPTPATAPVSAPTAAPAAPSPRPSAGDFDLGDEEQVRFDLSGFQNGTNRADRELGGNDS